MKIFTIFKNNLRIISRNLNYFIILILCPMILILLAGTLMNSINLENIKIGVVRGNSNIQLNNLNFKYYDSMTSCLYDITNSRLTVCIDISKEKEISVYLDNSKPIVEYYAKQAVLEGFLKQQSDAISITREDLNSKITMFSSSLYEARRDINLAIIDLDKEEKNLREYQNNLTRIIQVYDSYYFQIKNLQAQINSTKSSLNQNEIRKNIEIIRSSTQSISNQISILSYYLAKLPPSDRNYTNEIINSISNNLSQIQISLNYIDYQFQLINTYSQNLEQFITKLDEVRTVLYSISNDLNNGIVKIQTTKSKLSYFISKIDSTDSELMKTRNSLESTPDFNINFIGAFGIDDDLILVVFPTILAVIIVFTSIILPNMFILGQINKPSYLRESITPTSDFSFIFSNYLVNIFFISIQIGVLFLFGIYWFGMNMSFDIFSLLSFILLSVTCLIFFGMSLAYFIRSPSLSMLISVFSVMIFFIFSDLLAPSSLASQGVKYFIDLNPFVIINKCLFGILILDKEYTNFIYDYSVLAIYLFFLCISVYFAKKYSERHISS